MNLVRDIEVSPLVILSVAACLLFIGWQFLFPSSLDQREPPEVKATIPVVGHLFGMIWHRAEYVTILRWVIVFLKFKFKFCRIFPTRLVFISFAQILLDQEISRVQMNYTVTSSPCYFHPFFVAALWPGLILVQQPQSQVANLHHKNLQLTHICHTVSRIDPKDLFKS
jgi:hypothetical protein